MSFLYNTLKFFLACQPWGYCVKDKDMEVPLSSAWLSESEIHYREFRDAQ